jgi:hypothetical protein
LRFMMTISSLPRRFSHNPFEITTRCYLTCACRFRPLLAHVRVCVCVCCVDTDRFSRSPSTRGQRSANPHRLPWRPWWLLLLLLLRVAMASSIQRSRPRPRFAVVSSRSQSLHRTQSTLCVPPLPPHTHAHTPFYSVLLVLLRRMFEILKLCVAIV